MPTLTFLGTACAVPDIEHENTHLLLTGETSLVLIDGPGSPFVRLQQAGVDSQQITDIIVTHFHPDHVSGIPQLLLSMALTGREQTLNLYANAHCMSLLTQMLNSFNWQEWCVFPVEQFQIEDQESFPVLENQDFRIYASLMAHYVPTHGLRIESKTTGKIVVYSCDTAPNENLARLAQNADVLIHEATGEGVGHSTAEQAGNTAREAGAGELFLVHYEVNGFEYQNLVHEAASVFDGIVRIASDFDQIDF